MNNDFRILMEDTFEFKGGKLYLMLMRENSNFGVEVMNRTKTFGRKMAKDREEADLLYDFVSDKIKKYKTITDAEDAIKRCFVFKSVDKLLFILMADDNVISQNDIVSLKDKVNLKTRVKINYLKNKKKKDALTVYVFLGSDKKAFGVLTGTLEAKDLKFELL